MYVHLHYIPHPAQIPHRKEKSAGNTKKSLISPCQSTSASNPPTDAFFRLPPYSKLESKGKGPRFSLWSQHTGSQLHTSTDANEAAEMHTGTYEQPTCTSSPPNHQNASNSPTCWFMLELNVSTNLCLLVTYQFRIFEKHIHACLMYVHLHYIPHPAQIPHRKEKSAGNTKKSLISPCQSTSASNPPTDAFFRLPPYSKLESKGKGPRFSLWSQHTGSQLHTSTDANEAAEMHTGTYEQPTCTSSPPNHQNASNSPTCWFMLELNVSTKLCL
jgi:hypothetical protein